MSTEQLDGGGAGESGQASPAQENTYLLLPGPPGIAGKVMGGGATQLAGAGLCAVCPAVTPPPARPSWGPSPTTMALCPDRAAFPKGKTFIEKNSQTVGLGA